ncbi:MAG: RtcB family protein [Elainella sp. Prado103]|nr:RtcB family protein [Elainella sp. Prado103]
MPDPDLSYFVQSTPEFDAYWQDLQWFQRYALRNREVMKFQQHTNRSSK